MFEGRPRLARGLESRAASSGGPKGAFRLKLLGTKNLRKRHKNSSKEQHKTLLELWQKEDKPFHEIHVFQNIFDQVQSQSVTTIIGGPGSGKTATARHLALRLRTDYEIVPVDDILEIKLYGHPKCKQLFILDDVIGVFGIERERLTNLERYKEIILNILGEISKFLFTCRKAVYKEAANLNSFVLAEESIVDLEDNKNSLNDQDRLQILNNHCIYNGVSLTPDERPDVPSESEIMMYPLLCKLFCSESQYRALGKEFFNKPRYCILKQLDSLQRFQQLQYASLVLCMLCKNEITMNMLQEKHPKFMEIRENVLKNCRVSISGNAKILEALDNMVGTFTAHTNDQYLVIHDSVYEVLAFQYGNENQEDMLQYMSSSFVAKKFKINDISNEPADLHIKIHEKHYPAFARRLIRDLQDLELHDVFMNETLKTPCICDAFINVLKKWPYLKTKKFFFQKQEHTSNIFVRCDEERFKEESIYSLASEWNRQRLLVHSDWEENSNIRVISWVITYGHSQLLRFLFDHVTMHKESIRRVMDLEIPRKGGNSYISDLKEQSRLLTLSCYSGNVEALKLLLNHCDKQCIDGPLDCFCTPLVAACFVGHLPVVDVLICCGASINKQDRETPLYAASNAGHVDIVDMLIKRGADCNKGDIWCRTPLYAAAKAGHCAVVDLLIRSGADCNKRNKMDRTPLLEASGADHVDIVNLLVNRGADCNQSDKRGITPLYVATEAGHGAIVDLLIKGGADCKQVKDSFINPLYAAAKAGHVAIVDLLIKSGADSNQSIAYGTTEEAGHSNILDCNQGNEDGDGPIYAAADIGHGDIIDLPSKRGAYCNQNEKYGTTPLHTAAKAGHVDVVDLLIKCGAVCNKSSTSGKTPLYAAAEGGHVNVVDLLIKCGADCNQSEKSGTTAIYPSAKAGYDTVVNLLVEGGAVCNKSGALDRIPLYAAAEAGHVDVVDLLIKGGADCNESGTSGRTPLFEASVADRVEVVEMLIKSGADCHQSDKRGITPLYAAAECGHAAVVKLLIKFGADCNKSDKRSITPLYAAAEAGHGTIVDLLIKGGADCNQSNKYDTTPLYAAAKAGHRSIVDILIKSGADCNESNEYGNTPIYAAAKASHGAVVDLLIKGDADCNQSNDYCETPLYAAAKTGHVAVVDLLIKSGADCNQSNENGNTPLYAAAELGHDNIVDLLIRGGADCNQNNKQGTTPLCAAAKAGHGAVVDLLIKSGADCKQSDKHGTTPLCAASETGHGSVVDLLINGGADINQNDDDHRTPLYLAAYAGHTTVVDLLIKGGADCNKSDIVGITPLHEAAKAGQDRLFPVRKSKYESIVKALIGSGADINQKDLLGESPLSVALKYSESTIVDILLKHGAKSNLNNLNSAETIQSSSID